MAPRGRFMSLQMVRVSHEAARDTAHAPQMTPDPDPSLGCEGGGLNFCSSFQLI